MPALLAFALLSAQIAMPWTVSWFATQDGPSHLYNAVVASNLVLHRGHTHFASVYQINRRIVPNWTATILLAAIEKVAGVDHAEKLMVSLCLFAGFFAFSYAVRCFAPKSSPWTPLANFLIQTWFLWMGFYNFYLAMLLALAVVGYYVRGESSLTMRRGWVLGAGLLLVFFTQLLGAAIAIVTLGVIAVWMHVIVPGVFRPRAQAGWRQIGAVALTTLPVLLLTFLFVRSAQPVASQNDWLGALRAFPLHVFATAPGRGGGQIYLWPAVLSYIAAAALLMTRAEWRTARGGLVLSMIAVSALYVAVPEKGLGGDIVKVRFAWGVFLLGGLLVASVNRMCRFQLPVAIYVSVFMIANLAATSRALSNSSDLIGDYLAQAGQPPHAAGMIRLRYQTPDLPPQYAMEDLGRDPIFHLDALIAARCRCLDLSDYEAPSEVFPVVFRANVERGLQFALWGMEGPGADASTQIDWLRAMLPASIDYVLVVADASSPAAGRDEVLANLTRSGMQSVSSPRKDGFVEAYRRTRQQ